MRLNHNLLRAQRGFTLIELLVVITIIGILTSIIVGGLSGAKASARDARRISDIKNVQLSLTLYYNDNGHYPCTLTQTGTSAGTGCYPDFTPGYMATIPRDPSTNSAYPYTSYNSGSGGINCLNAGASVSNYHIGAVMENAEPQATNGLNGNWNDTDWTASGTVCSGASPTFNGLSTACNNTTNNPTSDFCYDFIPN